MTSKLKHQGMAFLITAKTNIHPGAGSESYGVIDNLVQRDAAFGLPTIHSTSLKGALREYFEHGVESPDQRMVNYVFGSDPNREKDKDPQAGNYRFFAADLVSIPIRCDKKMYVNLTCPQVAKHILDLDAAIGTGISPEKKSALEAVRDFNFPDKTQACHFEEGLGNIHLEENDMVAKKGTLASLSDAKAIFGDDIVVATDAIFMELTDNLHLPVVARNQLNNGVSENLWYEQMLPRETRFWFPLMHDNGDGVTNFSAKFISDLRANPVQIGANASVGFGFCRIQQFPS